MKRTSQTGSAMLEGSNNNNNNNSTLFDSRRDRGRVDQLNPAEERKGVSLAGCEDEKMLQKDLEIDDSPHRRQGQHRRHDSLNRRWAHAMTPIGWRASTDAATMPARLRSRPGRRTAHNAAAAIPGLAALDRQVGVLLFTFCRACPFEHEGRSGQNIYFLYL